IAYHTPLKTSIPFACASLQYISPSYFLSDYSEQRALHSFPTRRSSDLDSVGCERARISGQIHRTDSYGRTGSISLNRRHRRGARPVEPHERQIHDGQDSGIHGLWTARRSL